MSTIAAIASSGTIGVVRVSGPAAIIIAKKLFRPKKRLDWSALQRCHMAYGILQEPVPATNKRQNSVGDQWSNADFRDLIRPRVIDECICLIFPSPRSYTGEDVVEFQCHGGPAVMRRALEAVFAAGARPAEPGEFTRRAYLNGRIDLAKAEAVMQLVAANSEQAARAANAALGGALSQRIESIRNQLIAIMAHIAAWVDYPEDDIPALGDDELSTAINVAASNLKALLEKSHLAQVMLCGVNTVLVGKPNVGKSSLMNMLTGYDRSIVTELPGTTRDTVTETIQLGSLTLRLTDTAGLRDTQERIEAAGVQRSRAALAQADLLLAVCDASAPLTGEDHALLSLCDPNRTILIRNKCDLGSNWTQHEQFACVDMSALKSTGLDSLAAAVELLLNASDFSPHEAILANRRQSDCAAQALAALEETLAAQRSGYSLDAISICIEDAIQALYSLTGERATDAVVDEVFANFCVGK